jgi:cell division septum initiation protein DivIVA
VQRFGVEDPSDVSVVDEPGGDPPPESVPTSRDEPRQEREEPPHEQVEPVNEQVEPVTQHEEPLAEMRRLEVELERYREHAQRTSKLFLSATKYVEWVRENARRDAELALRKARAKVEKLDRTARELERTERELARVQDELARLQALTDETRARLSAFLAAGLQVLNSERAAGQGDSPNPALGDLQDALQEQLPSTSVPAPAQLAEVVGPEL